MLVNNLIRAVSRQLAMVATVLVLAACGSGLEGTYSGKNFGGMVKYTFESNGKVTISASVLGVTSEFEADYELEGDKVKMMLPDGQGAAMLLTLNDDGSLTTPFGKMTKMAKEEVGDTAAKIDWKSDAAAPAPPPGRAAGDTAAKTGGKGDSGFSLMRMISSIFAPNVDGNYLLTAPQGEKKLKGQLQLALDSGKATMTRKIGARSNELVGKYVVEDNQVKITDSNGRQDVFAIGEDRSLIPQWGSEQGTRFILND